MSDRYSQYQQVRQRSLDLCLPLTPADVELQAAEFTSPAKWHLAHTTWFFETFLLKTQRSNYRVFHPLFEHLFNSYYNGIGQPYPRGQRGLLSRPSWEEVLEYRAHVDVAMQPLLDKSDAWSLIELGLNHEQQHQELLLTDLKYCWAQNPIYPTYHQPNLLADTPAQPLEWVEQGGGIFNIGHKPARGGFVYDNEGPRHKMLLQDYALANRLVTNEEFEAFINDHSYQRPELWLADGWAWVQKNNIQSPLYWLRNEAGCINGKAFGLEGVHSRHPNAPVCHISFYEADAYARWAGKRLLTEFEWEVASKLYGQQALTAEPTLEPLPAEKCFGDDLQQLFGHCWQWTQSSYAPYPGFKAANGAIGEYNGKFMCGQFVLRGGCVATPAGHARVSYRNFFPPHARWAFAGLRLAKDI